MKLKKILQSKLNKLFIFETNDGFFVEAVYYRGNALCVSTQVGCPVRCAFCASGKKGFFRNLSEDEIIWQYNTVSRELTVKNIAIAGIGEPALNIEAVKAAVDFFKSKQLKVTITSSGFESGRFLKLLSLKHSGFTFSLHFLKDSIRKKMMVQKSSLDELLYVFKEHIGKLTKSSKKKYQIGYLLIKGLNDSDRDIFELSKLSRKLGVGVMLMMLNPVDERFKPVSRERYEQIFKLLRSNGVRVTLSNRFRTDPLGGCGTLTISRLGDKNAQIQLLR